MHPETPLTEPQARALAFWWGGVYQAPGEGHEEEGDGRHGVVLAGSSETVWSREQAREVENRRRDINPAAPDWVG